jgi:hypothetical protein
MRILDRFTRDRQSRFIWGGATAGFVVLGLLAFVGGRAALSTQERNAEELAVGYTDTVLFEALDADLLGDEIRGRNYRDLIIQVQGGIMTDEGVARVRIWALDGTLLFSTESLEQIGVAKAVNSEPIEAAARGQVTSVVSDATVAAKSGLSGTTQRLFQTYAPIRVRERTAIVAVAEIDRTYASMTAAAERPWRAVQIAIGAAALLCAVLLVLSLRRPTSTLGSRIGVAPPPQDVPAEPLPADRNALRLRNELERERQTNRKLQAELEAGASAGASMAPGHDAAAQVEAEAAAARLAAAESALSEAGAHTAELERALADARAQAVPPEALASLEERVVAAEVRAREAELRLRELMTAPPSTPEPVAEPEPTPPRRWSPEPEPEPEREPEHRPTADAVPEEPASQPMDLRSRLARTAARKKLGSHVDDEPGS